MIANIGFGILLIALIVCLYAITVSIYGGTKHSNIFIESGRLAAGIAFPLITLSTLILVGLMLTGHFEYTYVFRVTSLNMPAYLKLTALWGGQAGSLLFWVWLLSAFIAAGTFYSNRSEKGLHPWLTVVMMTTLVFFLVMVIFIENPFERIWLTKAGEVISAFLQPAGAYPVFPTDGSGLNPLLRHPGMIIHPPLLYAGFVAFIVPFAYAVASLAAKKDPDEWIKQARPWGLFSWIFLSAGLVVGSRWAYDVLGWGGYWGWDPVEIAALMPWLTCTAFLHSSRMQERKGFFRHWNYVLAILTFCLVILGTFLTRSGLLSSVHAFSGSSIGPVFFGFIVIVFVSSMVLLLIRWKEIQSPAISGSVFSRESLYLFNNIVLVCICVICLIGVLFPTLSEWVTSRQVTVGPQWYKSATGPLFATLLVLMGIVPLSVLGATSVKKLRSNILKPLILSLILPVVLLICGIHNWAALVGLWLAAFVILVTLYDWVKTVLARRMVTHTSFLKASWNLVNSNRHRYGGFLVHIGVVLLSLGIIGMEFFQTQIQATIPPGGEISLSGFTLHFDSANVYQTPDGREITSAVLSVSKKGVNVGMITPRLDDYIDAGQTVSVPGLVSNLTGDLYVVLSDWQPTGTQGATFNVFYNPLIDWLWIGAIVLILGGIFAFWPERSRLSPDRLEAGEANMTSTSSSEPQKNGSSRSMPIWVILMCLIALIGFLALLGWGMFKGQPKSLQVGDTVPDFSATTFTGETVSLSELRGKTVVINFWASWCADCANEAGLLEGAWQSVQSGDKVVFIGVDYSDAQSDGAAFLKKYSISYLNGTDPGAKISSIFRVTGVPETYVIGPDGKLIGVKIGPYSSAAELQSLLGLQE